jgi:hypothetical protein
LILVILFRKRLSKSKQLYSLFDWAEEKQTHTKKIMSAPTIIDETLLAPELAESLSNSYAKDSSNAMVLPSGKSEKVPMTVPAIIFCCTLIIIARANTDNRKAKEKAKIECKTKASIRGASTEARQAAHGGGAGRRHGAASTAG